MEGSSNRWTGWVAFAGWLMIVIGAIDAFEGLIAIIRKHYYVFTPQQLIIFDVQKWGWITLVWGIILAFAGWSLLARSGWARWFTIVAVSINILAQLGFLGETPYPLWAATSIALSGLVLFATTARWEQVEPMR
jgi:hypothetical protein